MDQTVDDVFSNDPSSNDNKEDANDEQDMSPTNSFNEEAPTKTLSKAMFSFKTLAECPITMVSLYSSNKQLVGPSLPHFCPK